ncbi:uncharacterized protein LOC143032315 [Oratosquilla oratoria]|uniref:uncharacterized protein LOC143032315 n=1 Tax=Oratosquilla oratoria TaxID=337810 RepID=UPI003F75F91E
MALYDMNPDPHYSILPASPRTRRFKPGKHTILVAVLLSFLLLTSQVFRSLQLGHPPKLHEAHILQLTQMEGKYNEYQDCIKSYLGRNPPISPPDSCHRIPASRGLCSLTQNLFFSGSLPTCEHQTLITFCQLRDNNRVSCEAPYKCRGYTYFLGHFAPDEEDIKWTELEPTALEKSIKGIIQSGSHQGFVFIKCVNVTAEQGQELPAYDSIESNDIQYSQLLLLPPKVHKKEEEVKTQKHINVNLILVDSVSHLHFYRSLPHTVEFLETLVYKTRTRVLDFQHFQSIKHRTYENLQSLFSGYVNTSEAPFGIYDVPKHPLPVSKLFGPYKEAGYQTLWLEDLCWQWEWGLVKDLSVHQKDLKGMERWKKFKEAFTNAKIDGIDLTLSTCEIFKANGINDPFHHTPSVCFNGQYQHEYFLDYLWLYQTTQSSNDNPFITFTSLSVGHEETGVRIQTLDDYLKGYLQFAERLRDTITIVFSDHGNTYGQFLSSTPEAEVEIYNPFMMMIIPEDVQKQIGSVQLQILKENQNHLITLLDLHNMLLTFIQKDSSVKDETFKNKYTVSRGLLNNISKGRTCGDLPLLQPNLCICANFELMTEPKDIHSVLADFGLGILNNMILSQNRHAGNSGFGRCTPLQGTSVRSVREIHVTSDLIQYKLDVVVEGYPDSLGEKEKVVFFLVIEVGLNSGPSLKMVAFDRMSMYQKYSSCQDSGVDLKLCICQLNHQRGNQIGLMDSFLISGIFSLFSRNKFNTNLHWPRDYMEKEVFGVKPKIDYFYKEKDPCLFTLVHLFKSGFVLNGVNFCSSIHKVKITINSQNMYLSEDKTFEVLLRVNDAKLLAAGVVANPRTKWDWNYEWTVV